MATFDKEVENAECPEVQQPLRHTRFQFHHLEEWKQKELLDKQAEKARQRQILEEQVREKRKQKEKEAEIERERERKEEERLAKDANDFQKWYSNADNSARSNQEETMVNIDGLKQENQNEANNLTDEQEFRSPPLSQRSSQSDNRSRRMDEIRQAEWIRKQTEQRETRKLLEEQLKEKRRRKELEQEKERLRELKENERIEREQRELLQTYQRDTGVKVTPIEQNDLKHNMYLNTASAADCFDADKSNSKEEKLKREEKQVEYKGESPIPDDTISSLREQVLSQQKLLKEQAQAMLELREHAVSAKTEREEILAKLREKENQSYETGQNHFQKKNRRKSLVHRNRQKPSKDELSEVRYKTRKSDPGVGLRRNSMSKTCGKEKKSKSRNQLNIRSITLKRNTVGKLCVELEEIHERCVIKRVGKSFEKDDRQKLLQGDFIIALGKFNARKILQDIETIDTIYDLPNQIPYMKDVQLLFKKAAAMVTFAVCQVSRETILSTVQYSDEEDDQEEVEHEEEYVSFDQSTGLNRRNYTSGSDINREFLDSTIDPAEDTFLEDEETLSTNSSLVERSLNASSEFVHKDNWGQLDMMMMKTGSSLSSIQTNQTKNSALKSTVSAKPSRLAKSVLPPDFF